MKTFKRLFVGLVLFTFALAGTFAQEATNNVMGGLDGVFERDAYEEQASNPEVAYAVAYQLVQAIGAGEITELYQLTEDTIDDEDEVLMNDVKEYISANYKVKNNQGYSFIVLRSQSEEGIDGWLAFYHYSKKGKPADMYYYYYFCIEF